MMPNENIRFELFTHLLYSRLAGITVNKYLGDNTMIKIQKTLG